MKKFVKLKLNQLGRCSLERREMNFLFGGSDSIPAARCGCYTPSDAHIASLAANNNANNHPDHWILDQPFKP